MQDTVKYKDKEKDLSIVLSTATTLMGMQKTIYQEIADVEAPEVIDYNDVSMLSKRLTQTILYPSLVACVIEHSGFSHWPPTKKEFEDLPDVFVAEWERKTFELNPHWKPKVELTKEQQEQLEKKVINSMQS